MGTPFLRSATQVNGFVKPALRGLAMGEPMPPHTYSSFAQALLDDWMNSPGHRENILSDEAPYLGAACAYQDDDEMPLYYCVQLFFDGF
jgi:uncharacterized protein YkwD